MLNFKKNAAPGTDNNTSSNGGGTPPTGMPFMIDILELTPSRMNPRKAHAGEYKNDYESLKNSIRNIGLQSTLTVTKLTLDSEHYELYNGGNTRLKILTELYEECLANGEEDKANSYRYQQVIYVPYTDDLDVLVKHMAENEERIGMTFIDKARAVFQIKQLYLQQNNIEKISNRKLVEYIHSLGWTSVNQPSMTEIFFAYEKLDRAIPLALNSGMGKPKIQQLRLWLGYVHKYIDWLVEKNSYDYSSEQAETLYLAVLAEYDDDIEPIHLNDFFSDFIFKLSDKLMTFDNELRAEKVQFELQNIEEVGYVMEERDPEELSRELQETSTVPPMKFPEPRKPREVKQPEADNGETTGTETADAPNINANSDNTDGGVTVGDYHQETVTGDDNPPPAPVVTLHQTHEALLADCQAQIATILDSFVERLRMSTYKTNFLKYGDQPNDWHSNTPFFSLEVHDKSLEQELTSIILSGTWPEQYSMLHLLYMYVTYDKHCFVADDYSEGQRLTAKVTNKLWREFAPRYNNHKALCEFGFIKEHPLQQEDMLKVHHMANQHIALTYAAEQANFDQGSPGNDGGE